jgi:hypothetical protein
MAQQAATSISNWKFFQNHVQSELQGGQFISAATILIAAGPPRLRDASTGAPAGSAGQAEIAFPVGVIENFGMSQNRQLQRMFEIGSKRSYFIPGRTIGSLSLGRVLFFGPSILRTLYAYYPTSAAKFPKGPVANPLNSDLAAKDLGLRTPKVNDRPGFGRASNDPALNADFWINLASDLFDHPLGLLVFLRDAQNDAYGAFYLEDVNIQAHQLNVNASSVLVAEGTSAQYDKVVPINVETLPLEG